MDGVRRCEQHLQESASETEAFVAAADGDAEAVAQLLELLGAVNRCISGLNALHTVDSTSDVVRAARAMATGAVTRANASSTGDAMGNTQLAAEKDLEIMRLRGELDECRDDLRRDEEIFAEKMKELKKNKKEVRSCGL